MKAKITKRIVSVLLSVCMLAALFTCIMGLQVSAAASDTQMLHAKATTTGRMFGWRCTT